MIGYCGGVIRCGWMEGSLSGFGISRVRLRFGRVSPTPNVVLADGGERGIGPLKTWFFCGPKPVSAPLASSGDRTDCANKPNPPLSEVTLGSKYYIEDSIKQSNHNRRRPRFPRLPRFGCFLGWSTSLHNLCIINNKPHCQLLSYPAVPSRSPINPESTIHLSHPHP